MLDKCCVKRHLNSIKTKRPDSYDYASYITNIIKPNDINFEGDITADLSDYRNVYCVYSHIEYMRTHQTITSGSCHGENRYKGNSFLTTFTGQAKWIRKNSSWHCSRMTFLPLNWTYWALKMCAGPALRAIKDMSIVHQHIRNKSKEEWCADI